MTINFVNTNNGLDLCIDNKTICTFLNCTYTNNSILSNNIIGKINVSNNIVDINFNVDNLMFIVRPAADPYSKAYTGSYPKIPPVVSIFIKFTTKLPSGEQVPIYYQTSVATNQYDIPNQ
jgi:hypothetical protein